MVRPRVFPWIPKNQVSREVALPPLAALALTFWKPLTIFCVASRRVSACSRLCRLVQARLTGRAMPLGCSLLASLQFPPRLIARHVLPLCGQWMQALSGQSAAEWFQCGAMLMDVCTRLCSVGFGEQLDVRLNESFGRWSFAHSSDHFVGCRRPEFALCLRKRTPRHCWRIVPLLSRMR